MSGGSYNYLCHQIDARGHLDLADLEAMRDRLNQLAPGSAAAKATARLHAALSVPVDDDGLTEVWHDVEWLDSGDYGEDQAHQGIKKYEDAQRAAVEPKRTVEGDLAARLLAAIDETEPLALHAHGDTWTVGSTFAVKSTDGEEVIAEGEPGSGGGVIDIPTTAHIIHNDPQRVLRRCAADRKILAEHPQVDADHVGDQPTGCATCHNDPDCGITIGKGNCTTILLLADGYGVTTEETT